MPRVRFGFGATPDEKKAAAISALTVFFNASSLPQNGVHFQDLLDYYAANGPSTFLNNLGEATALVSSAKVQTAMRAMAADADHQMEEAGDATILFPHYYSYFQALSDEALTFRMEDATAVVRTSGAAVIDAATGFKDFVTGPFGIITGVAIVLGLIVVLKGKSS